MSVFSEQHHDVAVVMKNPNTSEEIERFREAAEGNGTIFIFGRVIYRDQFQWLRRRYANFCFRLTPRPRAATDPPGTHPYGFDIVPYGYNDAIRVPSLPREGAHGRPLLSNTPRRGRRYEEPIR